MIDPPAVELTITPLDRFAANGALSDRVGRYVNLLVRQWRLGPLPACEFSVASPPDHVGLGVGTQLGLAAASGLRRFLDLPDLSIEELSSSVGRGARSAVGTHGFRHGGLIVDAGKKSGQRLGALVQRASLPAEWRIVLVRPGDAQGLAGDYEADAFARLPPVADEVTRELWRITEQEMLPSVERADCDTFGEAVYRFGRLAGACFAPVQGGPFASAEIARLVEAIRKYGVSGVGQSSWGPTVFAFTATHADAQALSDWLHTTLGIPADEVFIAGPTNRGAQISMLS